MRVCVFGAGLIGGSIAKGLQAAQWSVMVHDPDPLACQAAQENQIPVIHLAEQLHEPDLLVVAVDPAQSAELSLRLLQSYPKAIVTDTSSSKSETVLFMESNASPCELRRFVPGHPLVEGAAKKPFDPSMFKDCPWALCPSADNNLALGAVKLMLDALGARSVLCQAAQHDQAMGWSSQLARVSACALQKACSLELQEELGRFTSSSFLDCTESADEDPWLWQEVLLENSLNLIPAIDSLHSQLDELRHLILGQDSQGLANWLSQAKLDRSALTAAEQAKLPADIQ